MSDTSGQDSSGGGNGIFSNPTFQKLLQKTIGLVAQLHGGQDPNAAQAGAPTGAQQPGAGAPPQGGPAAALQQAPQPGMPQGPQQGPTSHNGMTLDQAPWSQRSQLPPQGGGSGGGQGSAPPSGATGQTLGAPQMPQAAAPPMQQGPGTQGSVTNIQPQQNFSQAPWMAGPLNDYAAFSKANPMPKAPTYEDAAGVAEQMSQQKGFAPTGSNTNSLDYTPMVPGILAHMNEQYKEQMEAHRSAWTGQIQAGHAHNQAMAEAENARHNKATEENTANAITGKGTAAAASTAQKASAAGDKHADAVSRMQQGADRLALLYEQLQNNKDTAQGKAIQARINEEEKNQRSAATNYVNLLNGNNADTPEGKAEGEKLKAAQSGAKAGMPVTPDTAQKPQAPPEAVAYLKAHPEMKKAFEEKYAPVQ